MTYRVTRTIVLLGLLIGFAVPAWAAETTLPVAATPAPRTDQGWKTLNEKFNERSEKGDVELLFLGDSITQGWGDNEIWKKFYGARKPANFGIGGDRTQHVLWRIQHGNLKGIKPRVAVLMIGTNNAGDDSAEDIAEGIKQIVGELRKSLPETKVLLLAIFPRGDKPNPIRENLAKASQMASEVADGSMVYYLDIGPKFLSADGSLSKEIMPDYLHLSPQGYQIWAESIEPEVAKLLDEKKS